MENKHNLNYFKKSGWQKPLGFALLVLGLLFLFFGWSYLSYILMIIFIPAGVALFLIGSSVRSTDEEIDEFVQKNLADFKVAIEEDRNYTKRILKHLPPETVDTYRFEEGLMFTKTKTGSVRTSEYSRAIVYVLFDEVYIAERNVSIVTNAVQDRVLEIPYDILGSVEVERELKTFTFGNRNFTVTDARMHFEYGDGFVFDLPISDNIGADQLADKIKKAKGNFMAAKSNE